MFFIVWDLEPSLNYQSQLSSYKQTVSRSGTLAIAILSISWFSCPIAFNNSSVHKVSHFLYVNGQRGAVLQRLIPFFSATNIF